MFALNRPGPSLPPARCRVLGCDLHPGMVPNQHRDSSALPGVGPSRYPVVPGPTHLAATQGTRSVRVVSLNKTHQCRTAGQPPPRVPPDLCSRRRVLSGRASPGSARTDRGPPSGAGCWALGFPSVTRPCSAGPAGTEPAGCLSRCSLSGPLFQRKVYGLSYLNIFKVSPLHGPRLNLCLKTTVPPHAHV